jgi:hypothetical protein
MAPAASAPQRAYTAALTKHLPGPRLYFALAGLALAIAAASLLIPSTPSYDPWSWLIWGREIVHLKLHTTGGPSWKPLPVVFTTLFAPFGRAAPDLWLLVARAGALMAVAMVCKLCVRFTLNLSRGISVPEAGRTTMVVPVVVAAGIAAVGLTFSVGFISDNALGYSEGLMTALVLIAVDRGLEGAHRQAFAIGFLAALDRPEIWLLWGPYGLWLWWKDPGARKLVAGLFVLIPVFWFLPEYWGSGHFFRGVNRAQHPRSNSPAFAKCPFCTELSGHAWPTVLLRIKVAAMLAAGPAALSLWRAARARGNWLLQTPREHAQAGLIFVGVLGVAWWAVIAIMTQAGFSGNNRYLILGAALVDIAGGVAWGWAALELGRRLSRVLARGGATRRIAPQATGWVAAAVLLAVLLMPPNLITNNRGFLQRTHRALVYQARLRSSAAAAVAQLGGQARIFACGTVMTEGFQVPMLAWTLGVHSSQVQAAPLPPGPPPAPPNVVFQTRAQRKAHLLPLLSTWSATPYTLVLRNKTFRVFEHCAH